MPKVLGKMKDLGGSECIKEIFGLRSKTYAYVIDGYELLEKMQKV